MKIKKWPFFKGISRIFYIVLFVCHHIIFQLSYPLFHSNQSTPNLNTWHKQLHVWLVQTFIIGQGTKQEQHEHYCRAFNRDNLSIVNIHLQCWEYFHQELCTHDSFFHWIFYFSYFINKVTLSNTLSLTKWIQASRQSFVSFNTSLRWCLRSGSLCHNSKLY